MILPGELRDGHHRVAIAYESGLTDVPAYTTLPGPGGEQHQTTVRDLSGGRHAVAIGNERDAAVIQGTLEQLEDLAERILRLIRQERVAAGHDVKPLAEPDPHPSAHGVVYVATHGTKYHDWLGIGSTDDGARDALLSAWRAHNREFGLNPSQFARDDINVVSGPIGSGFRDYDRLSATSADTNTSATG